MCSVAMARTFGPFLDRLRAPGLLLWAQATQFPINWLTARAGHEDGFTLKGKFK